MARIDRSEARIHDPAVPPKNFALAIHRVHLAQVRLERSISSTIADLDRYRKQRIERQKENGKETGKYTPGLVWSTAAGERHYTVLPKVLGLGGVWREIPREAPGDFPAPPDSGDQTAPPIAPRPNGQA